MLANGQFCQIPSNPDIAGIGVRASTYVQACLVVFNLVYVNVYKTFQEDMKDKPPQMDSEKEEVDPEAPRENDASASVTVESEPAIFSPQNTPAPPPRTQTQASEAISLIVRQSLKENADYIGMATALQRSVFMIGFAIILSAILETKSRTGLSAYHILVVLNLSQINNWSGYLLFDTLNDFPLWRVKGYAWSRRFFLTKRRFRSAIPCLAHSLMMAGFGLYFWSNPASAQFQVGLHITDTDTTPCPPPTYLWVFGAVAVSNRALQISSLIFYAICALPMIDMYFLAAIAWVVTGTLAIVVLVIVPLACIVPLGLLFAVAYFILLRPVEIFLLHPRRRKRDLDGGSWYLLPSERLGDAMLRWLESGVEFLSKSYTWKIAVFLPVGISLCAPIIYSIVSTELTIHINRQNVDQSEDKWTYGQTLALFTALVALYLYVHEFVKMLRRRRRKAKQHASKA